MNTNIHKFHAIPGEGARRVGQQSFLSRPDVWGALIVMAVLLGGAALGEMISSRSSVDAAQQMAAVSEPQAEFSYFPSQYVNQATELEEHIQAF